MTQKYFFPVWFDSDSYGLQGFLSEETKTNLTEFREEYDRFGSYIDQLPLEERTAEVYSFEMEDLLQIFPDPYSAALHVSEFLIGRWYWTHAYKLKSSFDGMHYALGKGNFLLAIVCGRSMFEEVLHFSYFLKRLATKTKYLNEISKHAGNKLKKGGQADHNFSEKTFQTFFDIWTLLEKSLHGTDFDWKEWHKDVAERYLSENISQELPQFDTTLPRKTHMDKLVVDFEKKTKIRASLYYDLLSEMVHPNGGSNKLVISTRNKLDEMRGDLVLSATPKNLESAAFFFECFGKILADVLHHAKKDSAEASGLYQYYRNWAEQIVPPH